jgi:hypothetical protein
MNVNVTKIQRLPNGIIEFYNGADVVDSFSITSSVSVGFESNVAKTIIFSSSVKTLSFNVFNIISLYGSTSNKIFSAGIDPSDTSSAYVNRLYDIYGFLISDVIQGCCPGPTFVGGVVAVYPNFASFPATGQQSVIYIDESTNQAYFWDGSSYQLLTSTGVEQYATFALFPVTGSANVIYIDMSVPEPYVWDGAAYVSLSGGGGTAVWGGITGTLSAQTDLQAALNAKFDDPTGTTAEYIRGDGSLATFPAITSGTVTSVGLTMPSAFSVASSPVTTSGTLAVTGAGTVSQYVRGDGSLANFPASSGGGASLSFYLNGSVAQGTFGGVAMKQMDRTPILGAGTDFTIATNGYIQSFITDANVPNLLEIPAGNWNFETYFSASSSGGTPSFYIELYKWDGATLSLIASNSATPEGITNGTVTDLYVSALAIPQTTLALTDRLAVRIWVNNSGRTIKLHTENSHLCQVITTFSTGVTALNGLTAQVQNFATGTTGTDFAISSTGTTHTFDLPTASAANRGALSSADWTTFNGKQDALGFTAENTANKQNSLAVDGTGVKFPTVDAVNSLSMIDRGKRIVSFFTDFITLIGLDGGQSSVASGGSSTIANGGAIPNRTNQQGVIAFQTGTSSAFGYVTYYGSSGSQQLWFGGGAWNFETLINISALSTLLERYRLIFGFGSVISNAQETDGVFITYDEGGTANGTAASANWQCVTVANSVRTLTTTTTAVTAAAWNNLRIEVNAAGTSVTFYVNGTAIATHTTNIPLPSSSRYFHMKMQIAKQIGLTSRAVYCDYVGYENILTTPRT